jgi:hypothetical protein
LRSFLRRASKAWMGAHAAQRQTTQQTEYGM